MSKAESNTCTPDVKFRRSKRASFMAFAYGIPRFRAGHGARRSIISQLKAYDCRKVRVDHNSDGHCRGWAYLFFDSLEHRDRCCFEMDNVLTLSGSSPGQHNVLRVMPCDDVKKCQSFPSATALQRLNLQLDVEAFYSITDENSANDMTDACISILDVFKTRNCVDGLTAFDCTAGGGGNTAAFIRSNIFHSVISFEVDHSRSVSLLHNLKVLFDTQDIATYENCQINVLNRDCIDYFLDNCDLGLPFVSDLVFLDPPWGGTNYKNISQHLPSHHNEFTEEQQHDQNSKDSSSEHIVEPSDVTKESSTNNARGAEYVSDYVLRRDTPGGAPAVTLSQLLSAFIGSDKRVKVAAVKVPSHFDAEHLFRQLTSPSHAWASEETLRTSAGGEKYSVCVDCRPHPFRLQMGTKVSLLLICYPPFFSNSDLDLLMAALVKFDDCRGNEFHPRFYDWEKSTWISARRWKPSCSLK